MEQPWHSLAPLHVALPLVGAALLLLLRRRGPRVARAIVMTNVVSSLILASLLIATHFSGNPDVTAEPGRPNMSFRVPWLNLADDASQAVHDSGFERSGSTTRAVAADVSLSFDVDGVSLWFLGSIPLIVLCVLLAEPPEKWSERPLPIVALLVGESAALAVFVVQDIVLLSAAFGVLGFSNCLVVGSRGGPGIRAAARAMLLQHLGATAFISISLAGTAVACSHMLGAPNSAPQSPVFDLNELVHEVRRLTTLSPPAQLVWSRLSPWLFLSLIAGCCLWSGVFPFHVSLATALRESGPAGRALLGGITLKVGVWVLIRVALPVFPDLMAGLGPFLILGVMLSALYCAVSMNAPRIDAAREPAGGDVFLAEGAIVIVLLSMCGVLSQTVTAVVGAALLLVAHMVCWMLYVLHTGETDTDVPTAPHEPLRGRLLIMLALAGIPGLALFPGLLLMSLGFSVSPATVESWLAILLLFWLVIAMSGWAHLDRAREPVNVGARLTTSVRLAAALLTGVIVLIGIAPEVFTAPIHNAVLEIMQQ